MSTCYPIPLLPAVPDYPHDPAVPKIPEPAITPNWKRILNQGIRFSSTIISETKKDVENVPVSTPQEGMGVC